MKLDGVHLLTEKPDPRPAFRFEEVTNLRVHDTAGAQEAMHGERKPTLSHP